MRALIAAQARRGVAVVPVRRVQGRPLAHALGAQGAWPSGPTWRGRSPPGAGRLPLGRVRADGSIDGGPFGLAYPVYAASSAVLVLTRVPVADAPRVRSAWLRELRRHQVAEDLGWKPDDPAFGGWGYSPRPPTKRAGATSVDADISSTLFAVGALWRLGIDPRRPGDPQGAGLRAPMPERSRGGPAGRPGIRRRRLLLLPRGPGPQQGRRGGARTARAASGSAPTAAPRPTACAP